jgi:CheY-like chemotaxis protein
MFAPFTRAEFMRFSACSAITVPPQAAVRLCFAQSAHAVRTMHTVNTMQHMSDRGDVLVVDDDDNFRAIVGELLKAEGCTVREATNGREAMEMVRAHVPDLILTDLMMPTMSGWELRAELGRSERLAHVPVAVLSGVARSLPCGVLALSKPVELSELLALLESVLPGGKSHDPGGGV